MKQLGNLAIICAQRPEVLLQIHNGVVVVHADEGSQRATMCAPWDDDTKINDMIRELNFGRYAAVPVSPTDEPDGGNLSSPLLIWKKEEA